MSRRVDPKLLRVGDLVRVPSGRVSFQCYGHSLPQGSVCEVVRVHANGDVDLLHPGPLKYPQVIHSSMLRAAKQATQKRNEYASRRG